jgi:hypothetical protein
MVRPYLVFLRWKIKVRSRLQAVTSFHISHDKFRQVLTVEILSFASLFGIAMGLLEYHRFYAAIILFAIGSLILGIRLLIAVFVIVTRLKWLFIFPIIGATIWGTDYLVGVVIQAESEYYASTERTDEATSVGATKKPSKGASTNSVSITEDISGRRHDEIVQRPLAPKIPEPKTNDLSLPQAESEGAERLKIEREQLALEYVPSVAIIYRDSQVQIFNNGKTNVELWAFSYGIADPQVEKESRLITPGTFYYLFADQIEKQLREVLQDNQEGVTSCRAWIETQDKKRHTIKCSLIGKITNGSMSIHSQTIGAVDGWVN